MRSGSTPRAVAKAGSTEDEKSSRRLVRSTLAPQGHVNISARNKPCLCNSILARSDRSRELRHRAEFRPDRTRRADAVSGNGARSHRLINQGRSCRRAPSSHAAPESNRPPRLHYRSGCRKQSWGTHARRPAIARAWLEPSGGGLAPNVRSATALALPPRMASSSPRD